MVRQQAKRAAFASGSSRRLQAIGDPDADKARRPPLGRKLRSAVRAWIGWTLLTLVTLSLVLLLRSFSPYEVTQRMAASVSIRDLLTLFAPAPHRRDNQAVGDSIL